VSDLVWITLHRSWRFPMVHRWRLCPGGHKHFEKLKKCTSAGLAEHGTKGPDFTGFRSMLRYYSSSTLAAFLDKNQILSSTKGQVVSEQWPTLRIFDFGAVLTLFCAATNQIQGS
jgi:hypothetical protein